MTNKGKEINLKHSHKIHLVLSILHPKPLKCNDFRSNILQRFEQKFEITSEKQFKGSNNWFGVRDRRSSRKRTYFSLELIEKFKGPTKSSISSIRYNEHRLYIYFHKNEAS